MAPSNTNTGLLFVTLGNVDPYLQHEVALRGQRQGTEVHQELGSSPWRQPRAIERRPAGAGRRIASHVIARREFGIFLVLVALILYFNARNSAFTGRSNWATLVEYGSPILIAAVGETMLLICGEIDLSVGHVYALAPLVLYKVAEHGLGALGRPRRRPRGGRPGRADERPHHRLPEGAEPDRHARHVQRPERHITADVGRLAADSRRPVRRSARSSASATTTRSTGPSASC